MLIGFPATEIRRTWLWDTGEGEIVVRRQLHSSPDGVGLLPLCYPARFCCFGFSAKLLSLMVRPARLERATF